MKRGYMNWDRALLPEPALLQRRDKLFRLLREKNLDALVVYGDVINADDRSLGAYRWGLCVLHLEQLHPCTGSILARRAWRAAGKITRMEVPP